MSDATVVVDPDTADGKAQAIDDGTVDIWIRDGGGCHFSGPGRGDCAHFVRLPGESIPGQHDGPDDTLDCYDKPNGWCWPCWNSERIKRLEAVVGKRAEDLPPSDELQAIIRWHEL